MAPRGSRSEGPLDDFPVEPTDVPGEREDKVLADPPATGRTGKGPEPTPVAVEPEILAKDFISRAPTALQRAFLHEEQLTHGTRKLARSVWKVEYDAFLTKPR